MKSLSFGRKKNSFSFPNCTKTYFCWDFKFFNLNEKTYDKKVLKYGWFRIDEKWNELRLNETICYRNELNGFFNLKIFCWVLKRNQRKWENNNVKEDGFVLCTDDNLALDQPNYDLNESKKRSIIFQVIFWVKLNISSLNENFGTNSSEMLEFFH